MQHSILFISAPILWHLQNVFPLCSYITQISDGGKSLHLQVFMRHIGAQQYMMSLLDPFSHLILTIFCLETPLRLMRCKAYCPSLLFRKHISNSYWSPCTPYGERQNGTVLQQIVFSLCQLFAVCICVSVTISALDHTQSHLFVWSQHSFCSGGMWKSLLMQDLSLTV